MSQRVFVNSTFEDLILHRQSVAEALRKLNMQSVDVVETNTPKTDLLQTCLLALHSADLFVGIYATRYGDVLEDEQLSLTERIYEEACLLDVPRFVYVVDAREQWAHAFLHTDYRGAMMRIFLDRVHHENPNLRYFTTPEDLAEKVTFDLARYQPPPKPQTAYSRRHFLIGMLIVWLVMLAVALRLGPIV